ncbi:MAG: rod shape-determining protein MreD [Actinomycetota bacterium]|nr:rod shape-determining protein MreD [Actinomycetota bacterium]MDK1026681.1 rod shape-determining protein MreD [Actinomycetota bacterium]MDK1038086.1 rod shape-determining protein MreD [Actinomycetota bacterium]MDK1103714.1 rod shape-determining protein MreD [Actinomycetota bacterium]MDK1291465.1 rod shape-determining protein MreD [Actinomycetota bacterium]
MMSRSRVVISLLVIVAAIVLQTTVFAPGRIQPLGVAPALVTLAVIAISPHIESEYLLLVGFTAGILMDLIGGGTLGLWAMTLTVVAYAASRFKVRFPDGPGFVAVTVIGITVSSQLLYVLFGTLFGQGTITEPRVLANVMIPGVWNLVLAVPAFWIIGKMLGSHQRGWAT